MGILSSAFGSFTVTSFIKNQLKDTEFGKTVFGVTDKITSAIKEKASDVLDGALSDYASHIEKDKWDSIVDAESMNAEIAEWNERVKGTRMWNYENDPQHRQDEALAQQFGEIVAKEDPEKWQNMKESIENNPFAWGQYLNQKGVTSEKLAEMEKEGVSGYDMLKLTLKMNVSEAEQPKEPEQTADEPAPTEISAAQEESAETQQALADERYEDLMNTLGIKDNEQAEPEVSE